MKLSAIFIIDEIATRKIMSMKELERMNYLLGNDDEEELDNHLLIMEDFTETQTSFYEIIKERLAYPKVLKEDKMFQIYRKDDEMLCILKSHEVRSLDIDTHLTRIFPKRKKDAVNEHVFEKLNLEDWIARFMDILRFASKHRCDAILVFTGFNE